MLQKSGVILFVICGLFTFITANSVSTNEEDCPRICPDNYDPVCATDGNIYKEFSTTCELKANNCRLERSGSKKYETTDMDWCSTELIDDFDILLKNLGNLDLLKPECLKPCHMIFRPVCISNGQYRTVVSHECIMDAINCALPEQGKSNFRILQSNSC